MADVVALISGVVGGALVTLLDDAPRAAEVPAGGR